LDIPFIKDTRLTKSPKMHIKPIFELCKSAITNTGSPHILFEFIRKNIYARSQSSSLFLSSLLNNLNFNWIKLFRRADQNISLALRTFIKFEQKTCDPCVRNTIMEFLQTYLAEHQHVVWESQQEKKQQYQTKHKESFFENWTGRV
jgi:hypothetical protein